MAAMDIEPGKALLPYLQRADELQKHEPLVAYYCRLYAMERGLHIPQSERTKTTNSLLVSLINQLEQDKKKLNLGPDDSLHLEGFALNVFEKADKQDRAGKIDLNTAKTFYAASVFFDVLNQFGELQPDFEQKQKYAVWKAADIRKAIKEGRKPEPGNRQVEEGTRASVEMNNEVVKWTSTTEVMPPSPMSIPPSLKFLPSTESGSFPTTDYPLSPHLTHSGHGNPPSTLYNYSDFPSYPSFVEGSFPPPQDPSQNYTPSYYQTPEHHYPTSVEGFIPEPPQPSPTTPQTGRGLYKPEPEMIAEAHKVAKLAVGALAFDDVSSAVEYLRKSLALLTNPEFYNQGF